MDWIGDLARPFLTSLYTLRVPIAVGSVLALVLFAWIARRRGWFAAARRNPGRSAALVIALLAVGIPLGWYLGSPLIIRTALDEPRPSIGPTSAPATLAPVAPTAPVATSAPAATTPPIAQPTLSPMRTGEFEGADDFHFGRGTVRLIETAPGTWVVRFEDFSVRNGPDLYVYLSPDPKGYDDGAIELGTLKATDGNFNYDVPAGTDVGSQRSVVVWCKQFAVPFAVARLS